VVSTVPLALANDGHRRGGLRAYFANVARAASTIFEGLSVTMSWMFRRPATIQYPDKIEKPVQEMLPDTYRGILEVDVRRCVACLLCMRSCPIDCIKIETGKDPETGARMITRFDIDMGRCMYCGLCAEACAYDALVHTTEFEATVGRPEQLVLHFVQTPAAPAKIKPGEGEPRRPRGSILPGVMPEFGRRRGKNRWFGKRETTAAPSPAATTQVPPAPAPAPEPKPAPSQEGHGDA
jgi:formate hydrogenlyase subunit 6/NADH:ubiquinone oxidoreductase subunit I